MKLGQRSLNHLVPITVRNIRSNLADKPVSTMLFYIYKLYLSLTDRQRRQLWTDFGLFAFICGGFVGVVYLLLRYSDLWVPTLLDLFIN